MCPPVCSAGLAALLNFALLVYAFTLGDWGPITAIVFVAPFAASVTLLLLYWNSRISWYAGWVLLISGVLKIITSIVFSVMAGVYGGADDLGFIAGLAALAFVVFAGVAGLSGMVDAWAGWAYACRRGGRGTRLRGVELGTV